MRHSIVFFSIFETNHFLCLKNEAEMHQNFANFIEVFNQKSAGYTLHVANRIYSNGGFAPKEEFVNTLAKNYQSQFQQMDFVTRAEEAREEINNWVKAVTNNKITDLLSPGLLTGNTSLVCFYVF